MLSHLHNWWRHGRHVGRKKRGHCHGHSFHPIFLKFGMQRRSLLNKMIECIFNALAFLFYRLLAALRAPSGCAARGSYAPVSAQRAPMLWNRHALTRECPLPRVLTSPRRATPSAWPAVRPQAAANTQTNSPSSYYNMMIIQNDKQF